MLPLIYVQITVPEVYRKPAEATVQGRTSNIVELAVIHNYRKEGRRVAVVQRPIIFIFEGIDDAPDRFMVVSRGYKTDFASLPRLSRYFFNPFDEYAEAAIVHDWLYAIAEPGKKREADMIFLRAMLDDGVSPIVARYFYTAVRAGGLFGGGGYGRKEEWTDAFYSVPLETELVEDCIPEKPQTALYRMSDVVALDGVSEDSADRYNAMYAVMLQGYDPMTEAWLEALSSEACRISLGSVIVENAYTDLAPILSQFTDDQERAHVEHMLINSKASTIQTDLFSRDLYAQRFLDAYFQYRFGEPVPDKIRCIGVEQRLQLMLDVLWDKSDEASWPEIECAVVEGQDPVLPSEAAQDISEE
ncbi:MAG: DUF1353 domain-containing protein [Pseudomonadota bacterium]